MSKYTLIVHFKKMNIGRNKLQEISEDLSKASGFNVICFDEEVELKLVDLSEVGEVE